MQSEMLHIETIETACLNCNSREIDRYSRGYDYEYCTCDNEFYFVSCRACGLVYLSPMPSRESLPKVYPAYYKPFHFNKQKADLILFVRNILESRKASFYTELLPADAVILDVGCGDGRYLNLLKQAGPESWRLEGIDFGAPAIERARERGLAVTLGAYESLELGEERYDLIILNQVIEHFTDPAAMVEKLHHELKPGGYLSIETPSLDGWDAALFKESFWGGYHFPRHITLFNERSITRFLEKRGFTVEKINYLLSPVFWVFSCHHAWENKIGWGAGCFSDSNPLMLALATLVDVMQKWIRRKTSNMQVIARKRER